MTQPPPPELPQNSEREPEREPEPDLAREPETERSLQRLAGALRLAAGAFHLFLVPCAPLARQRRVTARLREILAASGGPSLQAVELGPGDRQLYDRVRAIVQTDSPPGAIAVLGLEAVSDLEGLLVAANSVRDSFRHHCPVPIAIWVGGQSGAAFRRVAADLESWASPLAIDLMPSLGEQLAAATAAADAEVARLLPPPDRREAAAPGEGDGTGNGAGDGDGAGDGAGDGDGAATDGTDWETLLARLRDPAAVAGDGAGDVPGNAAGDWPSADRRAAWEADLEFLLGRQGDPVATETRDRYGRSLAVWEARDRPDRVVCLHFWRGMWWRDRAQQERQAWETCWERARDEFAAAVAVCDRAGREDWTARVINAYGFALQQLHQWDELSAVAERALQLHGPDRAFARSQVCGFLAKQAEHREDWAGAQELIERAIALVESEAAIAEAAATPWIRQANRSWDYFLRAKLEQRLGHPERAIASSRVARDGIDRQDAPVLYGKILRWLGEQYRATGDYRRAFEQKLALRSHEQQFGLRAFVGAGRLQPQLRARTVGGPAAGVARSAAAVEIEAFGRQPDVDALVRRIDDNGQRLTVLYGYSGVGKSSLVRAGLIPALEGRMRETRDYLPVLVERYRDWERELGAALGRALAWRRGEAAADCSQSPDPQSPDPQSPDLQSSDPQSPEPQSLEEILAVLRRADGPLNLKVVLIFDQFEEFFFEQESTALRNRFFAFLQRAFEILSLDAVLSIRSEYLHLLLGRPQFVESDGGILGEKALYWVGALTRDRAREALGRLTARSRLRLSAEAIAAIVDDLAGDSGKVRPIEMQIVGAQLEAEWRGRSLSAADYAAAGGRLALVRGYLADVRRDCGPELEPVADLALVLLTDEQGRRPQKTRSELWEDLGALRPSDEDLDWVLEVLVKAGLAFQIPEEPQDRYQLVHDYLAEFIRQDREPAVWQRFQEERQARAAAERSLAAVQAELAAAALERDRVRASVKAAQLELTHTVAEKQALEANSARLSADNQTSRRRLRWASVFLATLGLAAIGASSWASQSAREIDRLNDRAVETEEQAEAAEKRAQVAEDKAEAAESRIERTMASYQKTRGDLQDTEAALTQLQTDRQRIQQAANRAAAQAQATITQAEAEKRAADTRQAEAEQRIIASEQRIAEAKDREREAEKRISAIEREIVQKENDLETMRQLGQGEAYRWSGEYDESLQTLDRIVETDPDNAVAYASRGSTYGRMGRYQEAIEDFSRAIDLDPGNALARRSRGEAYRLLEKYDRAFQDFNRAIELQPDYVLAWVGRGAVYRQQEQYDLALADLDRAIAIASNESIPPADHLAIALRDRGVVHRFLGDLEPSLDDFNRALNLTPEDSWAYAGRGATHLDMHNYQDALADFNRAIEIQPDDAWAFFGRGRTHEALDKTELALADYERAIELNPDLDGAIEARNQLREHRNR